MLVLLRGGGRGCVMVNSSRLPHSRRCMMSEMLEQGRPPLKDCINPHKCPCVDTSHEARLEWQARGRGRHTGSQGGTREL
jgi:hypothetical protein